MNRFTTLIAASTIAAASATVALPAQAEEYYVVYPDGQITREYTHYDRDYGHSYFSFSIGAPVIWLQDSYPHHYRDPRAHEWRERWQRQHRRHWDVDHHRGYSHRDFDDD